MKIKPKIYTLTTCLHCKALKDFLKKHKIEYDFVDVDKLEGKEREDVLSELMKISGGCRFPTIILGDKIIVGFYKDKLGEALGI